MKVLRNFSFGLLGLLVCVLMAATCVEKVWGTPFVVRHVYGSPWFVVCWALLAVAALAWLWHRRVQKHRTIFLFHLSLVWILLGALVTHVWGVQGRVHLRQGREVETFTMSDGQTAAFPFRLLLEEFKVEYYAGTSAPKDFVSRFTLIEGDEVYQGEVSMNRIFRHKGYRFYQSGYDSDGQGATLSVACDPWGIGLTYTGYALLLLSALAFFFEPQSGFRQLLRHPSLRSAGVTSLLLAAPFMQAADKLPRTLPRETAASFGRLYVYYNDRVCPLQTLAKDFTMKLYGKPAYQGLTAEQVLTGWFFYYDDWKREPCIRVKSAGVRRLLGVEGRYSSLQDFFGSEGYKLDVETLADASLTDVKAVSEANEKFSLVSSVATGALWRIFPYTSPSSADDSRLEWLSLADRLPRDMPLEEGTFVRGAMNYVAEQVARKHFAEVDRLVDKIRRYQQRKGGALLPSDLRFCAERLYNRLNDSLPLAVISVVLGLLSFVYSVRCLMLCRKERQGVGHVSLAVLGLMACWLAGLMVLRSLVSGHLPMSNGHETMHLLALCAALLTFIFYRRLPLALPFGFLVCGLALMVSMLGERNPQVGQLMPVLASPLLSVHVAAIMVAYALLAFVMLNGVAALALLASRRECAAQVERLQVVSRLLLYPAVFLLAAGIFIGAVWANVSWGRYWGWDPKEVWALVTMLVYALALHPVSLPCFRRPLFFHVFSVAAFFCVLVTYFGVNFLLGGMHSYA
ncbi:cytochrome c biogenesis protein CcsA [uncultured Bacteroides sp.]|uniref:cytochrome c biogenesis protein CcsA n=1 Tax=uncultured Bacteroides sp. TaxID=162156 RepID=UPI002615AFBD|nr:cytochrome c biogenesis protein CcsA [uncultured Bacteroides sp.]